MAARRAQNSKPDASGKTPRRSSATDATSQKDRHEAKVPEKEADIVSRLDRPHPRPGGRFAASADSPTDVAEIEVVNAHWLCLRWRLTAATLERAEKAFGRDWPQAQPTVRIRALAATDTTAQHVERIDEIAIPGDAREWFAYCPSQPYVDAIVGYAVAGDEGRFFPLATSTTIPTRTVTTPTIAPEAGLPDEVLAELQRMRTGRQRFSLELEAELLLTGKTSPDADVCIGERVLKADSNGRFEHRHRLENGRTVLPVEVRSDAERETRSGVASTDFNLRILAPKEDE